LHHSRLQRLNIRTWRLFRGGRQFHACATRDEAICIGKAPSNESYLRIDRIISAAEITDVDAITAATDFVGKRHFADVCENCNIRSSGPALAP